LFSHGKVRENPGLKTGHIYLFPNSNSTINFFLGEINNMQLKAETSNFSQSRKLFLYILKIFIIWRGTLLLMHLIGLSFSQMNESSSPQAPFWHMFPDNHYLDSFFRFDSAWYNEIIQTGYSYNPEKQSNVAFFPLYPILVKAIASLTSLSVPIAGLLLSNLCLIFALIFVYKISNIYLNKRGSEKVLILMLVFPTSFFYSCFYTESLYLLTTAACFYFFLNKKYFWSGFFGFFASLTRVTGVIIFLAFAIELLWKYLKKKELPRRESLFLLLIPCGLIAYMVFLAWKFNEPLAFIKVQDLWGRDERVFPLITLINYWRNINFMFAKDANNAVRLLNTFFSFSFLGILLFSIVKKPLNISLLIFAFLSFFLPLSTGTTESMMRYMMTIFPIFIILGYWSQKNRYFYGFLLFLFTYFLSILFLWYGNWGWIA
jgi:Gpi18-like mannosyltransferase